MGVLIPSCIGVAIEGTGDTVNKWIKCRKLSESVYISGTRATLDSKEQTSNIPHRSHIWMQWSSWRMHGCFTSHTISRCITGKTETVRNLKLSSIHTHTRTKQKTKTTFLHTGMGLQQPHYQKSDSDQLHIWKQSSSNQETWQPKTKHKFFKTK